MYRGVMRPYPHPRSVEYITGLAAMRGSQWGCNYAEAFQVVLRRYWADEIVKEYLGILLLPIYSKEGEAYAQ